MTTRQQLYPDIEVTLCRGETAITGDKAKELLGWTPEPQGEDFGPDYLLKDTYGCKIRCVANQHNRVFYRANCEVLKQELLRGRWEFNGEPIIIGEHGTLLNGQHSLVALVLAEQEWADNPLPYLPEDDVPYGLPTMSKLIVFGVSEDDDVVNTLDTCRPRTLSDVLFRSEYFAGKSKSDRSTLSRITDKAIHLLWDRTGVDIGQKTHAEAIAFLGRHEKLLECVSYLHGLPQEMLRRIITPGYAAALLYLMGASGSSGEYSEADTPNESLINWDRWEKAKKFWLLISRNSLDIRQIHLCIIDGIGTIAEQGGNELPLRLGTLIKAWECFVSGDKITKDAIKLRWRDGMQVEFPTLGGIDDEE